MLRGEADAVAGSAVRVWSVAGEVVGAGFVAGPDTVATCAHVVAEALGTDPYASSPPAGTVRLDLPLLGGSAQLTAVVSRWLPIGQDGTGDVALLRVREPLPVGARMPPLRRADQVWDRPFRALGFPDGAWDGVWASGVLRAGQGTGWVQLQSDPGGQPVVGGFSGSAVWDSGAGAVIGMTVAADLSGTTTAYLVPIEQVLGLDPDLLPCPYQGLAPFTEAQAAYFFGRDADIERLVAAVAKEPIVALAGPSGAGKSSLLRAGLVPRLRRAGTQIVELQPGATVDDFEPDGTDQVLVLDQFEEVATRDPRQARDLLEDVVRLTGSGSVRAVLTVRGAALDELLTPTLAQVLDAGTLHVAPLDRANLRETIVRPAERAPGLDFEPGLVDRILDDAGSEPGQLPLVESLLADLWRRREGGRLTWRGYTEAGGVVGAVAQHAERVVSELAGATPDPRFHDRLRRLFAQLAAPDRGGRFVRVPVRTAALPPEERALVPQLAAGRLLVVGRDAFDVEVVELAHQALIEHWPRLRDWLEQDRAFLAWRAQTDQQRERWESAGRDDGALLRGSSLVAAGEWVPAREAEVAGSTRDFVARSVARQRRDVRRVRVVVAVLAVLALAAGTLAIVSEQRGNRLSQQLATANADRLGRDSLSRADMDQLTAAQLALAAYRADPTNAGARSALGAAYLAFAGTDLVVPGLSASAVVADANDDGVIVGIPSAGRVLVTGAFGSAPQPWALPDDKSDRPIVLGRDWVAVADGAGGIRIWDIPTRTVLRTVSIPGAVRDMDIPRGQQEEFIALVDRGPAGLVLVRADVRSGTTTERPLPGAPADVVQVGLRDDTHVLLERSAAQLGGYTTGWAVRVLADDPAGDTETRLPPEAVHVGGGLARLTCTPGDVARRVRASVTLEPVWGELAPRTVGLVSTDCLDAQLTGDSSMLAERIPNFLDRNQDIVRLTSLTDGSVVQVVAPKQRAAVRPRKPLQAAENVQTFRRPDGSRAAFAVVGNTIRMDAGGPPVGLVRLRVVPATPPGNIRQRSTDGRYLVVTTAGQGIAVYDRATGARVGELATDLGPDNSSVKVDDGVWLQRRAPDGGWTTSRLELPSLRTVSTAPVPPGPVSGGIATVGDSDSGAPQDGPLVMIADGALSALDRHSGAPLGPAVPIEWPDRTRAEDIAAPSLVARPGHPGQVVIPNGITDLQLWDAVGGRKLGTIPVVATGTEGIAFDAAGRRMAMLSVAGTIDVYDLDTLRPVRAPIPVTGIGALISIGPDGYLVATGNDPSTGSNALTFFDLDAGRPAGTFTPGTVVPTFPPRAVRPWITTGYGFGEAFVDVPLQAEDWFRHLCGLMDRPFTEAELQVLPEGTDTSPPCRR